MKSIVHPRTEKLMNIFEFCEVRLRNRIAIINLVYFIEIYISLGNKLVYLSECL